MSSSGLYSLCSNHYTLLILECEAISGWFVQLKEELDQALDGLSYKQLKVSDQNPYRGINMSDTWCVYHEKTIMWVPLRFSTYFLIALTLAQDGGTFFCDVAYLALHDVAGFKKCRAI